MSRHSHQDRNRDGVTGSDVRLDLRRVRDAVLGIDDDEVCTEVAGHLDVRRTGHLEYDADQRARAGQVKRCGQQSLRTVPSVGHLPTEKMEYGNRLR